jgi:hypothetical protein
MKASELIAELEKGIKKHGDLPVIGREDGMGGHAYHTIAGISKQLETITTADFESAFEENGEEPNIEALKDIFPNLEIPEEIMDEEGNINLPKSRTKCFELSFGYMIYST